MTSKNTHKIVSVPATKTTAPFLVLLAQKGSEIPREGGKDSYTAPEDLVMFYDPRYPMGPLGQSVSCYCLSTIKAGLEKGEGINLNGNSPQWVLPNIYARSLIQKLTAAETPATNCSSFFENKDCMGLHQTTPQAEKEHDYED